MTHGADTSFLVAVHIVTDARRFQQPFSMETALDKSERWWNAAETEQVLPTDVVVARFHDWMRGHQLGRKRVLDTLLAEAIRGGDEPSVVADAIVAAATGSHPKLRYPAGPLARRVSKLRRYAPSTVFDRQIRKINQLNGPAGSTA